MCSFDLQQLVRRFVSPEHTATTHETTLGFFVVDKGGLHGKDDVTATDSFFVLHHSDLRCRRLVDHQQESISGHAHRLARATNGHRQLVAGDIEQKYLGFAVVGLFGSMRARARLRARTVAADRPRRDG